MALSEFTASLNEADVKEIKLRHDGDTLTITRTDDDSSNDDGECNYVVYRPYN